MDRRPEPGGKFCALHTIAELEALLGFGAGARVIRRIVEHCRSSAGGACTAPTHCPGRFASRAADPTREIPPRIGTPPADLARTAAAPRSAAVVPLGAAAPARTLRDESGNFVERRLLRTEIALSRGDALAELIDYWRALASGRGPPAFADLDPVRLAQFGLLGRLHVLNAANPDPAKMRFDLYGDRIPLDQGRSYAGRAIGEHRLRIYAESVAADYDGVRSAAEPRYFRVRKRLDGIGYRYARLVLPFSTGRGRVDRLVVAIRPEPDDGVPLHV